MWPMGCRRLTPGMRAGVPAFSWNAQSRASKMILSLKNMPSEDRQKGIRAHLNSEKKNLRSTRASVIIELQTS